MKAISIGWVRPNVAALKAALTECSNSGCNCDPCICEDCVPDSGCCDCTTPKGGD